MNLLKFFVFLTFLAFLAGCGHHPRHVTKQHHVKNLRCEAPNRPSAPGCYYALQIKRVEGDHAVGIVPFRLYELDGIQQGKEDPTEHAKKFKTEQNLYRIGVEGAGRLEEGKIYWFRSRYDATYDRPLELDTDEDGNILPGMSVPEFEDELTKRQSQGHKRH